jgi:DNA-binding response OmpR family regulator
MEAVLQRPPLRAGELEVRPSEFLVLVNGERLHLTVRELELLTALVERRNRIVTREELYREVWGEPYRKSDRSVDVYVGKLRQKLENAVPGRRFIHTHFGFGYRFAADGPFHILFTRRRQLDNRLRPVARESPRCT